MPEKLELPPSGVLKIRHRYIGHAQANLNFAISSDVEKNYEFSVKSEFSSGLILLEKRLHLISKTAGERFLNFPYDDVEFFYKTNYLYKVKFKNTTNILQFSESLDIYYIPNVICMLQDAYYIGR